MTQQVFHENVGEIVIQNEECFWIFPTYLFVNNSWIHIYSPWFSYLSEKWRFVLTITLTPNYHHASGEIYLWRKFRRNLHDRKYTVHLTVKNKLGETIRHYTGDFNCDYSLMAGNLIDSRNLRPESGLIKIFFKIEEHYPVAESSCTFDPENNKEHIRKEDEDCNEDESSSEDEESNDEEENEKKKISSKTKGIEILSENLKQMFLDGRMCDAVLKVDHREFNVHKVILAARSSVFASMFQHDFAEKETNMVDIPDCTADSFEAFLCYLYSGGVEKLSASNVYNVYYAADKYRVEDLKEKCVKFMKKNISVETLYDTIALSLRHGEFKLHKLAVNFFCENMKKIIKTVQWKKYMEDNATQANELLIKAHNA